MSLAQHKLRKDRLFLLIGCLILGIVGALQPLVGVGALVALLGLATYLFVAYRPWHMFYAYLFLLPAHVLVLAILLSVVHVPPSLVRAISGWKEGVLALLLLTVAVRLVFKRTYRLASPDLCVMCYAIYTAIFAGISMLSQDYSLSFLLYALRDLLLPCVVYFVGRNLSLPALRARTIFTWLVTAAVIFSLLGLIERSLIPTSWHVAAGIPRYYREMLGISYPDYLFGLPENYWTSANSGSLRRAVSVYSSSQPFALSFLLLIPVCAYGMFDSKIEHSKRYIVATLITFAALSLTFTRFTLVICVVLFVVAGCIMNRRAITLVQLGGISFAIVSILSFLLSNRLRLLVINTITFQDDSSSSRLTVWADTLRTFLEQPFGYGIGAVGQTASRFGEQVVSIEGQFSKIAVELGIGGLALYILVLLSISVYLLRAARFVTDPYQRGLCFAVSLTFVGLLINSLTTEWHNSIALVYPTWWLAGSCVAYAAHQRTRRQLD